MAQTQIAKQITAQIIDKKGIYVTLKLSNGFYGVGEFNDENHQITKLFHSDISEESLAKNVMLVMHIVSVHPAMNNKEV